MSDVWDCSEQESSFDAPHANAVSLDGYALPTAMMVSSVLVPQVATVSTPPESAAGVAAPSVNAYTA